MAKIINTFKWVRNNWKKSTFFFLVGSYGFDYAREKYLINQLLRNYCMEAKVFGEVKAPTSATLKKVLVILNPAANKRKCEENFEKYCAPILNLAGFSIEIFKSQSELHAIRYIEEELTEYPDAIVVAGGDGTLSETITGLLRRAETNPKIPPVGILPVGQLNQFCLMLLNSQEMPGNKVEKVKAMADATMRVVKGQSQKKDLMRIDVLPDLDVESEDNEVFEPKKPFYAAGNLSWGSFNDIMKKKDKYWVTGSLRNYTAILFNGFHRKDITWNCKAKLIYSDPCSGCSNCYQKLESQQQKLQGSRWWSKFNPKDLENAPPDYSKVLNANCLNTNEEDIDTSEMVISTNTIAGKDDASKMNIQINTKADDYGFEYIWNSWKRLKERRLLELPQSRAIEARTLLLIPEKSDDTEKEVYYSIDNESYEVKPIKITLLPKRVEFFM